MSLILAGEAQPVQIGGFLMVLRYRGETAAELAGFVQAARQHIALDASVSVDLDWPSYADRHRQQPWFVLAALLLAENGFRVLMHGIAGASAATLDASSSVWPFRKAGQLEVIVSEVDQSPVFTLTGGIFKDAPHPNAAKLYLTWFLAREQQTTLGSFSSRADMPPPEGFKPLTSYKIANAYREFMVDQRRVEELRARFERYTGPPVNKGGVR